MIRSMTAFAHAESPSKTRGWIVEIRSLNHRYFDFSLKSPPSLYGLEDKIRELCHQHIQRGKITMAISEKEPTGLETVVLDEKMLRFYLSALEKVRRRFHLKGSVEMRDLLSLPRIFSVEKNGEGPERAWRALKPCLEKALEHLLNFKQREGKALAKDILSRLSKIEARLGEIEGLAQNFTKDHYENLRERLSKLLGEPAANEEKIWEAAALVAERTDVTEEVVRLRSHLRLFREKMAKETETGKELDFLLQEMNRETNTIGSKAQDFGIAKEVISIKAELEKVREQVQNIE